MAKSAKHHSRDRIATKVLKNIFPESWLFKNPRDDDSGREYSEDWIVEIVNDDDEPTGVEFGIQNKTGIKVTKTHVSMPLTSDDVKRLLSLHRPILLHGYNMKSKVSYWRWFSEWYAKDYVKHWDEQKTVTVTIPLTNTLDEEAVKAIASYATWEHMKRDAEKRAELTNMRHGKDFGISVQSSDIVVATTINPLHDGSVPTIVPLDEKAQKSITQAIEMGGLTALEGKFTIVGIPDTLHESGQITLEAALVWTHQANDVRLLRIEFIGDDDQVIFKTGILQAHVKQQGTKFIRLEAVDQKNWTTYIFIEDAKHITSSFQVNFECKSRDAIDLEKFFTLVDLVRPVKKFRITQLDVDPEVVSYRDATNFFKQELSPNDQAVRLIVKAFALVQSKLNISIPVPNQLDDQLLRESDFIVSVFLEGFAPLPVEEYIPPNHHILVEETLEDAHKLVSKFEQQGYIDIYIADQEVEIVTSFAGHKLTLGNARGVFRNSKIFNVEELKRLITQDGVSENTKFQIAFEPDYNQGVWQFKNWPEESN